MTALELYTTHEHLARSLARKYAWRYRDLHQLEDYEQEARLGLWIAAQHFDPARGLQFVTLAWKVIRNNLIKFRRDRSHLLYRSGRHYYNVRRKVPLADLDAIEDSAWGARPEEGFDLADTLATLTAMTSPPIRRMIAMRHHGAFQHEIGSRLGCAQRHVCRVFHQLGRAWKEQTR